MNVSTGIAIYLVSVLILVIIFFLVFQHIPDKKVITFTPEEENRNKIGEDHIKNSTLTIGGLARNSAHSFEQNIQFFERMAKKFKHVNVAILENDSEDNTRELFLEYIKNNKIPNLDVKLVNSGQVNLEKVNLKLPRSFTGDIGHERIKKMVFLRNDLRESILKVFEPTDYIYISDFDILGEYFEEGINNTFGYFYEDPEIDTISYMGLNRKYKIIKFPFDPYAFEPFKGEEKKYSVGGETFFFHSPAIQKGLYRVESSFAGGFFGRFDTLSRSKYEFIPTSDVTSECEHKSFFRNLKSYVNTNMVKYVDSFVS